ncbi:Serine-pyruvate aminotransferase/archaeal aspartate aminotransferase [Paraburkholderia piptadeniae]|uniref:Serine-pyruvate aminotransferase/archaeal aspartate aminotransferase n=1 Tax=Paraburkholderia piptadeniae TaxID=1701573 RepID=A0A1N7RMA0_9BURK|nr:aminotransferase class V-fold PLP-dependent enzyme [Paraburkholderia piptadeniae]SIT36249.1 Serine-pyruvate aminotransferase/archaeal aspartate aminotransferase [Paraburkholderia piptadeniae]
MTHTTSNVVPCPEVESLDAILPEEPLLMMGAGPVPIPAAVAKANAIVINHLGGTMAKVVGQVKTMARYVFQTNSKWVLGVAGPGSAAMEMAISNLAWPGTRVLSIKNGFFSARMAEMGRRVGADVSLLEVADRTVATLEQVEEAIRRVRPEIVTIVQGETSNTVWNHHLNDIAALAKKAGALVVVDAVCTLSTMPLEMDAWGIDAVITGGQKGLSSIPGVSLIAFSDAAWERVKGRSHASAHWCLDASLAENFWHNAGYHYTAPVSGVLALHEALRLVCAETLEKRFARHLKCSLALQAGISAMGLQLYAPAECRLNSVVGIEVPTKDRPDLTPGDICGHISRHHQVEISGSFGLPIVRIGQMGEQAREHNLFRTLHAFGRTMIDLGVNVDLPAGVAALERSLASSAKGEALNA